MTQARPDFSRLFVPFLEEEDYRSIKCVFNERWLGLGRYVQEFERECADILGVHENCVVAVNSGTAALNLAVRSLPIPQGSLIGVNSLTFASSVTAILNAGHRPLLLDSDVDDCGLDLNELPSLIRAGARALILVHFGGYARKARAVAEFCKNYNIFLIEDCAHTFSSKVGEKRAGTFGDFGCFSFEEKKVMTCGDGGLLICSDKWQADINKRKRWVGIDRDTWTRGESQDSTRSHWFYEINELGDKWNMNNYSAVLGLSQIKKIERINKIRCDIIALYLEGLHDLEWVSPIFNYETDEDRSYWLFGIRVHERDSLISHLRSSNIATGVHYTPLHLQPLFRQEKRASDMAGSEKIYSEILTLPLHCYLTREDVKFIVNQVRSFEG